jgi:hypothetical protein
MKLMSLYLESYIPNWIGRGNQVHVYLSIDIIKLKMDHFGGC